MSSSEAGVFGRLLRRGRKPRNGKRRQEGKGPSTPLRLTEDCEVKSCQKNLGDAYASPVLVLADTSLSASFSSLPFSWLPWFLFSLFHFSWSCYSNGRLLQLIECIESLKSDVKKKMMLTRACDPCTKVTSEGWRRNFRECKRGQRSFLF